MPPLPSRHGRAEFLTNALVAHCVKRPGHAVARQGVCGWSAVLVTILAQARSSDPTSAFLFHPVIRELVCQAENRVEMRQRLQVLSPRRSSIPRCTPFAPWAEPVAAQMRRWLHLPNAVTYLPCAARPQLLCISQCNRFGRPLLARRQTGSPHGRRHGGRWGARVTRGCPQLPQQVERTIHVVNVGGATLVSIAAMCRIARQIGFWVTSIGGPGARCLELRPCWKIPRYLTGDHRMGRFGRNQVGKNAARSTDIGSPSSNIVDTRP